VEDVSAVFLQISVICTSQLSASLCVGSARDEQILLGVNQPSPFVMSHDGHFPGPSGGGGL
jgi:hypothetical protein